MSIRKWKVIAPLAMTAAGAIAAGVATLMKKSGSERSETAKPTSGPAPSGPLTLGSYSFISGYQNAATVEFTLRFDPETASFAVVGEDYLSYSSASHVALLYAKDFDAQIEYAPYYSGEDFEAFSKNAAQKYKDFGPVRYISLEGIRYRDGDTMVLCFPIPDDSFSYVQVILFKHKDNDDPLESLPESSYVRAILDTAKLDIRR